VRPAFLKTLGTEGYPLTACFERLPRAGGNQLRMDPAALLEFRENLDDLEEAYWSEEPGSDLLRRAYFTELMVRLNRAYRAAEEGRPPLDGEVSAAPSTRTAGLIRYINDNIGEDLGLDRLAAEFYVSKYHMLREFRRHTGVTIHQYVLTKLYPGFEPGPSFLQKDFNKIAEKNLRGQTICYIVDFISLLFHNLTTQ
jgi:hypothetical protein